MSSNDNDNGDKDLDTIRWGFIGVMESREGLNQRNIIRAAEQARLTIIAPAKDEPELALFTVVVDDVGNTFVLLLWIDHFLFEGEGVNDR